MATMQIPMVEVKYSDITITSLKNRTATITVQHRKLGSKSRFSNKKTINVKLSKDMVSWLWRKDREGKTGFQKYLIKNEVKFKPGILKKMVFQSSNLSEDYNENPFKIIEYADGSVQLTLTCYRPKIKVNGSYVEPNHKYYKRESYRRYVIQNH